ncbi:MAG: FtsX-like permease family protein, partial [Blastocatellia bacterium]
EVYVPYGQNTYPAMSFVARSTINPAPLSDEIRQAVAALDHRQPVSHFRAIETILSDSISRPRFNMILLVSFGAIALLLAAAGIYGVMSYTVTQQSHEIGVRVALGARYSNILATVMGKGLALSAAGSAIGVAGALAFTRLMSGFLFSVNALDPLTYVAVVLFLALVAAAASFIPARRAARVDPVSALRWE